MIPPIYDLLRANSGVTALIGSGASMRLYEFGEAKQDVATPYVVWTHVGGLPENKLADVPDMDTFRVQVDVYADKPSKAREIAAAIRDALEPHSYLTGYNFEGREPETRLFRYSFNFEFMTPRSVVGS